MTLYCDLVTNLSNSFQYFSTTHLGALFFITLIGAIFILGERGSKSVHAKKAWAYSLAWLNIGSFCLAIITTNITRPNDSWEKCLPLHFCSFMQILCILSLFTAQRWIRVTCFYGVFAAAIQGLITPDLELDFPSIRYFDFFTSHGLLVITALFLPLALKWRPKKWDFLLAQGIGCLYLVGVFVINIVLHTNYGFTMHPPTSASIMDYFGPWPWYLFAIQIPLFILLKGLSYIFIKSTPSLGVTFCPSTSQQDKVN